MASGGGGGGRGRNRRIQQSKLGPRQYLLAARDIAKLTWETTPGTIVIQVAGAIITAVLPIVTTFFAALTTTALGEAFAGDETAGGRAITYVVITSALGLLLTGWRSLEQYVQRLMRYALEAKVSDIMYERFLSPRVLALRRQGHDRHLRPRSALLAVLRDGVQLAVADGVAADHPARERDRAASGGMVARRHPAGRDRARRLPAVPPLARADQALELHGRHAPGEGHDRAAALPARAHRGTAALRHGAPPAQPPPAAPGCRREAADRVRAQLHPQAAPRRCPRGRGRGRLAALGDVPDHRPSPADRAVPLRTADRLEGPDRHELVRHASSATSTSSSRTSSTTRSSWSSMCARAATDELAGPPERIRRRQGQLPLPELQCRTCSRTSASPSSAASGSRSSGRTAPASRR